MQQCNKTFLKLIIDVNFSIDLKLCLKRNCKDISDKFLLTVRIYTINFDICIRANANHSELIRKNFCISFDEKWSKINPTQSD